MDYEDGGQDTISTPQLIVPEIATHETLTIDQKNQQAMAELTATKSFVGLVQRVSMLEQQSLTVADLVIVSEVEEIALVDLVGKIQTLMNEVELKRKGIVSFPRLFTETVNGLFGTPTSSKGLYASLKRARERTEGPVTRWKVQKEREEAEARRKAEAERLERLAKVSSGEMSPEEALVEGVEAPPPIDETPKVTVTKSGSAHLARNLEFEIDNVLRVLQGVVDGKIPLDCVKVTLVKPKLKQWVKGCDLKGEVVDLPGVRVTEKAKLAVSTKRKKEEEDADDNVGGDSRP